MATRTINPQSNPYGGGAVIFDSTPYVDFYVKQQMQEKAKDEALDKYFMDWDKSINPAGMRNVDTQDFMNLINENKGYYFKNKAAIKNPALDNGAAYNEWFGRNKAAMGLISQSKDLAGKEELINKNILQAKQKGLPITERVVEDLEFFRKPLKSKDWRDFNPDNLDFQPKPFDPVRFTKDVFGGIEFSKRQVGKDQKLPETKEIKRITEKYFSDDALPAIQARAASAYKTSPSVKEFVDGYIQDPVKYKQLNELFSSKYKKPIETAEDAATAVALTFSPVGKMEEEIVPDKVAFANFNSNLIKSRQRASGSGGAGQTIDFLKKGIDVIQSGNTDLVNDYFSAWKAGQKTDTRGGKIGFQSAEITPDKKVKIKYTVPFSAGSGVTVARPQEELFELNDPQLLNKLTGLHQVFLGSDVKAERAAQAEAVKSASSKPAATPQKSQGKIDLSIFDKTKKQK
ncbi:MAG: hypothetical protein B7Y37_13875 [Sphingobacteriia bacterium 28-36-52]|nr:MAG: hypothetical protein B7Y37_13875 [Sphingobacteriia bacterium 28-36-52]